MRISDWSSDVCSSDLDPAGNQRKRERQRMPAVAVGHLRNEQIVADQQGRDHRSGRDIEGLVGKCTNDKGDAYGDQDRTDHLAEAARSVDRPVSGSRFPRWALAW